MIDAKQAVQIAKEKAVEVLGQDAVSLEEIERDHYKTREVWSITLSLPGVIKSLNPFPPVQYKRFLIDVYTGELVAMKIREVASQ
jgi:hypothetical protein